MRKRILPIALTLLLAIGLTACSGEAASDGNEEQKIESSQEESATNTEEPAEMAEQTESGNILIAYYSHTGTTEAVAEQIASLTGGTLSKIERTEEYGDLEAEAEVEILEGEQPEISIDVESIEEYETIFVGDPIWWDEAPAMISTFLANNDFEGKKIIPFCTSTSDDIGNSLHIFEELCPGAVIAEGFTANNEEDIKPWLQELDML